MMNPMDLLTPSASSNNANILFVMQISVGGQDVAPLDVETNKNSIMMAKEFVSKHQLPSDQIMLLSSKIDNIRNQILSQHQPPSMTNIDNFIHPNTSKSINQLPIRNDNDIESQISESPKNDLQNIRNQMSQFYHKHNDHIDNTKITQKVLHKPSKMNIKIQNKSTNKQINTPSSCKTNKKSRKQRLVKPAAMPSSAKAKSSKRPCSAGPRRRKDWWNKLYGDADKMNSKMSIKQKRAKAQRKRDELFGCTFAPKITAPARTLKRDGSKIWKRIVDPMGKHAHSRLTQLRQRKKIKEKEKYKKECTFKPFILDKSVQIIANKQADLASIKECDNEKNTVFDRLSKPTKARNVQNHDCCSPDVQKRRRSKSATPKRRKAEKVNASPPRYVMLHELSYKKQKKSARRFHKDEDYTFKPRICHNKHVSVDRKSVINVSDHLYNQRYNKIHTMKAANGRRVNVRCSEGSERVLERKYWKQGNELYLQLCGEQDNELISVPFDRDLNEELFERMGKLNSMIIRSIERWCEKKSKNVLRKSQFMMLFSKLLPKCNKKIKYQCEKN